MVQVNRGMPAGHGAGHAASRAPASPLYSLETEFGLLPLAAARKLGLTRPGSSASRRTTRAGATC